MKIRVSLAGRRYIGNVTIPGHFDRMSDLLNGNAPFLKLWDVDSYETIKSDSDFIINKDHIDYVQVLEEEPNREGNKIPGSFFDIRVKTLTIEILGKLFVPNTGETPMAIVNDNRMFLSIKDAEIVGTPERYHYLGVLKRKICSVEVFQPVEAHSLAE